MSVDQESFDILLDSLRRYVRERLVPLEDYVEDNDEVPNEVVDEMKEMGLFGMTIPEQYGCIGLSLSQECAVSAEFCASSLAIGSPLSYTDGLVATSGLLLRTDG